MRLKRLDIVGFKSFLDKTVVQFDDGVTGVVGPNGCGKSNIVDAVRWVLGEQSPKHLRGSAMQDVIFSGSQSRPPVNMAEVTLTFVNDNPEEIPARYRSFAEIAVTRRLFRSGDSEYLINKSPCRLMDITEIFLGTGVGTKAYSIIEQGRIGLIVSAKADDRRALIEEAAGITRYKTKRRVAERKMEHTRNNLLRVGDLVSELGRRLDSLSRQAKKAERYKKLKAELKEIELHIASHRWLEIAASRSWIEDELRAARERAGSLAEEIASLEKDVRSRRDRLTEEESRLAAMQSKAAEAAGQAKVHLERVAGLGRERESLDHRTDQAQEEIIALRDRQAELSKEADDDDASIVELDEVLAVTRSDLEKRVEELSAGQENVRRLVSLTEAERQAAATATSVLTQCESQIAGLERRREELEARKAAGKSEIENLEKRLSSLGDSRRDVEGKLDTTKQLHLRLESERTDAAEALARCKVALEEAEQELGQIKDVLSEKRSRLQSLEEIQRSYEGYAGGVRSVMLNKSSIEGVDQDAVVGLVADVVRAEPAHEAAVEAVLGQRLQEVLVTDQAAALGVLQWLTREESGRSSFVPMKDLRPCASTGERARALEERSGVVAAALEVVRADDDHEVLLRHLLADVVIVDDIDTAVALWKDNQELIFVTLAGEVVSPPGTLTGGSKDAAGAGLLKARREIEELTTEVRRQETALAAANEQRERLRKRLADLEEGVERLSKEAHAEQINIVTHEKEVHRLSDEEKHLAERTEAVRAESTRVDTAIAETMAEREATEAAMATALEDREYREAKATALDEELGAARATVSELQDAVTALRVRVAEDVQRRDALGRQVERARQNLTEISRRVQQLTEAVEGSGAEFEALAAKATEGKREAERLDKEAEAMRTEVARGRETLFAASKAVRADEERLDEMRSKLEDQHNEVARLEMSSKEMSIEAAHIAESVEERHATCLPEAVYDWHMASVPTDAQFESLESIRSRLERIGEVNLTAIREHEEIAERHEFLSSQKADLEQSLDQLETAISRIDKTSKARFLETFERVNDLFQQVFPRLFNGGKAGLSLTEPSDPLRSGVEIFAQPPGKKLQNVNLLSGGEKALTATSLIFAMFLVRPTPFCLLDEVDAPLDDQNVHRYNQLVQEMSRRSQFILITHNKTTMEAVDTLYGVTMEEPGISRLVGVRLSGEGPTAAAA